MPDPMAITFPPGARIIVEGRTSSDLSAVAATEHIGSSSSDTGVRLRTPAPVATASQTSETSETSD